MSTRIFNLTKTSAPIPGPNLFWARDTDGKTTARHTFTMVKGSMEMPANQAKFKKGTPITSLDSSLTATLSFLTLEDFEVQVIPGGYEEITANFGGYTDEGDFEFDREVTYSSNSTLVEKSILTHPKFLEEVTSPLERSAFCKLYNGLCTAEVVGTSTEISSVVFIDHLRDENLVTVTDETLLEWYRLIFIEDHRTYLAPSYDWQKTTANAGGLSNAELTKLGKIDSNPPGTQPEPPAQEGYTWLKIAAADSRSDSSATTDEGWQWGYWPEKIYSDE